MGFSYLTNVPLDKAREDYIRLLKDSGFAPQTESVPVRDACGRVTASAVYAAICAPHYAACAMDGIALAARDSFGATDTTPVTLGMDSFTVVDTGDPLPDGCDAVIMVEELVHEPDGSVTIHAPAAPWKNVRQIGEDICAGEMILPSYTKITPAAVGALIAGGVLSVEVFKRPRVAIIPTGDEIVPPCADPKPGDIMEFNSSIFSAMLSEWGAQPVVFPIVPDDYEKIKSAVGRAVAECDMVLLNAGSSAGREDYSASVIAELGRVLYHGIAIKPGKPAILGACVAKPVLGVPGYPVSGIIVLEELLKPLVDILTGSAADEKRYVEATLTRPVVSGLKYREYVRVRMGYVGGRLMASPLPRGSGVVSSFMKADGIMEIPQDAEDFERGQTVNVRLLTDERRLKNSIVVMGSHDPLIDELADMLHRADPGMSLSSTHVGSMGGIMAIKRGEAHVAGCHLLDTQSGEYNLGFMRRYFPDGGAYLVRCVGRLQGLMVAKGDPLRIGNFGGIAREGVRYVTRQKGSGTRILADYLCAENGISPESIYGYDREELTHTSVAAQIASGSADAGMGIYSAAKLYDLDFLPVCTEEYDLIVSKEAWDTEPVRRLLSILKSAEFAERLTEMGGYTLSAPGEIIDYMREDGV